MPLLIIDEERKSRRIYRTALEGLGYGLYEANSGEAALEHCRLTNHDAVILGLGAPAADGFEVLETLQRGGVGIPAVLVTPDGEPPDPARALELGAIDFVPRKSVPDQLLDTVRDVLIRHIPDRVIFEPLDCIYYVNLAKRAINLRDFTAAREHLIKALDLDPESSQAICLAGVMLEMRGEP